MFSPLVRLWLLGDLFHSFHCGTPSNGRLILLTFCDDSVPLDLRLPQQYCCSSIWYLVVLVRSLLAVFFFPYGTSIISCTPWRVCN